MGGVNGRMEDMLALPAAPRRPPLRSAPRRPRGQHKARPRRPRPAPRRSPPPQRLGPAAPNFARTSPPLPGGGGGSSSLLLPLLPRSVCAERRPLQLIPSLSLMQIACWPPRPGFHPLLPSQTRSLTPPGEGGEAAGPPGTPLPPPRSGPGPLGSPLSAPLRRRGKAPPEQRAASQPQSPSERPSARGPSAVAAGMRLPRRLLSVEKKENNTNSCHASFHTAFRTAEHRSVRLGQSAVSTPSIYFFFPHPPTLQTGDPNNFCPVSSPERRLSLFTTRPGQKFSDGTFLSENCCVFRSRCFARGSGFD